MYLTDPDGASGCSTNTIVIKWLNRSHNHILFLSRPYCAAKLKRWKITHSVIYRLHLTDLRHFNPEVFNNCFGSKVTAIFPDRLVELNWDGFATNREQLPQKVSGAFLASNFYYPDLEQSCSNVRMFCWGHINSNKTVTNKTSFTCFVTRRHFYLRQLKVSIFLICSLNWKCLC